MRAAFQIISRVNMCLEAKTCCKMMVSTVNGDEMEEPQKGRCLFTTNHGLDKCP